MARVCVNDIFFDVLPDGRLTLKAENLGHSGQQIFNGGAPVNFTKADFPSYSKFWIRVVGGGGGGAGSRANAAEVAAQGGGGGGGYAETWLTWAQLSAVEIVTVGTGGAGGVADNPGANGTSSSFGAWVVGNGGIGSNPLMTSNTNPAYVPGGLGGGGSSILGYTVNGGPGGHAGRSNSVAAYSGAGGNSQLGNGGVGRFINGNGFAGLSYGGGGSGSLALNNTTTNGGAGAGGIVIVDVFF